MKNKYLASVFLIFLAMFSQAANALENDSEHKKQMVIAFYNAAINAKNFNAASRYLGKEYIQHNPTAEDGREGFKKFIQFLSDKYPQAHSEIKQVFCEGDYVILHVLSLREPNTRGRAIIDIFRLNKDKIVEHWDVVQDIPEHAANNNTMF